MSRLLTPNQIRTQVVTIQKKSPEAKVFGIKSEIPWQGPSRLDLGGRPHLVLNGVSELQIREVLQQAATENLPAVIVTSLSESEMSEDLRGRFAKQRVFPIRSWEIVKELFQARDMDPRLWSQSWIADVLIDNVPADGYRPAANGYLDRETVWQLYLEQALGLTPGCPDLENLFAWSVQAEKCGAFSSLSLAAQEAIVSWVSETVGPPAVLFFDALRVSPPDLLIPLGLACQVLFHSERQTLSDLRDSGVRLERFFGGHPLKEETAVAFGRGAEGYWIHHHQTLTAEKATSMVDAADNLLREVGADKHAHLSACSLLGFDQRLERFADLLGKTVESSATEVPSELQAATDAVRQHQQAQNAPDRLARIEMSLRLARALKLPTRTATGFVDAAQYYAAESCFVDWARYALFASDSSPSLAKVFARLVELASARRETENQQFGQLLADWAASTPDDSILLIENILTHIVAPVAKDHAVLLVVVDGMSYAVFQELLGSLIPIGWTQVRLPNGQESGPAAATLPTITEFSRRSLLCGALVTDCSQSEAAGFGAHAALAAVSRGGDGPILFVRNELMGRAREGLSDEILAALSSEKQRVVGVIVNAVDDHLLKGDQVYFPWTVNHVPVLARLLDAARQAGRWVILTSDHGHVLDYRGVMRSHEDGDRYRRYDGNPDPDEIVVAGPRVALSCGGKVIMPWSERVHYSSKKNGYHGGVAPQELLVPVSILAREDYNLGDSPTFPLRFPSWWLEAKFGVQPAVEAPRPRKKPISIPQLPLFELQPKPGVTISPQWIDQLLASEVYRSQAALAGRAVPSPDKMRVMLIALDERGGVILKSALAQRIGEAEFRIPGLIAGLRRLLNVDGYPVISLEEQADTIRLNRQLLKTQFELK